MAELHHRQHNGIGTVSQHDTYAFTGTARDALSTAAGGGSPRGQALASTIVATIPLGLGIALNPIAVVAGILILRTTNPRGNGLAYVGGWLLGLALLVILTARLVQLQLGSRRGIPDLPAVVWIALGAGLLIAAAWRLWRGRPLPGEEPEPPRWLRVVDRAGLGQSLGTGLFLSTVSLRNIALLAAAAAVIGQSGLGFVELGLTVAAFLAISSLGILIPVLVRLFGGADADATLARWSAWLNAHMGTIAAVVMAVLGLFLLGRGLAGVF
jgi:hypothetical protein